MTNNAKLNQWVKEWAELCQPDSIYWCDGSEDENQKLLDQMVPEFHAGEIMIPEKVHCNTPVVLYMATLQRPLPPVLVPP